GGTPTRLGARSAYDDTDRLALDADYVYFGNKNKDVSLGVGRVSKRDGPVKIYSAPWVSSIAVDDQYVYYGAMNSDVSFAKLIASTKDGSQRMVMEDFNRPFVIRVDDRYVYWEHESKGIMRFEKACLPPPRDMAGAPPPVDDLGSAEDAPPCQP